jgi:5'-3' exoribonuclease 2
MDYNLSKGINGSLLPNPDCLPGSTFYSPLTSVGLPDIKNDRALSALYLFPRMLTPHRSVLLPGVRRPPRTLTPGDLQHSRNGGRGRDRGGDRSNRGGGRGRGMFYGGSGYEVPTHHNQGRVGGRGGGNYDSRPPAQPPYGGYPPQQQSYGGYGGYGGGGRPAASNYGQPYASGPPAQRGGPPYGSRGGPPGRGGYGGYGGYGSAPPQNYGGYGSQGGHGGQGGYGGPGGYDSGGSYSHGYGNNGYNSRGRGRGGRF